ncbi:hypothetical protein MIH18_16270 [Marinobacter sp. M3C]|nr:hypothetical protein [Marinobacter sp. M3C]UQG62587.1 hypothetical protein MIH18_16270 [Marinobacter sp. M3C]
MAEVTDNREVFGESEGEGGNLKYFCDFVFLGPPDRIVDAEHSLDKP